MNVLWVPVVDFPSYEVSNAGEIRNSKTGKILKPCVSSKSYRYFIVTLRKDKKSHSKRIHVEVCRAFHGDKPSRRHQVAHNDGDSFNNKSSNLRWATPEENQFDRRKHGTHISGEQVFGSKLKKDDVVKIKRLLNNYVPCRVIADAWNVDPTNIQCIKQNKTWKEI